MIRVTNLTAGYTTIPIIKNLSFEVASGTILGIVGPNGSGKTTLLKALTNSLHHHQGQVLVNGKNLYSLTFGELAREIAVVSQAAQSAHLMVEEYVLLGRIPHYARFQLFESKKDREIAEKYMQLTGISSLKDCFMGEISGGERQLAVISKALVQEPNILLLDEPTTYLDISHQVQILDLVKQFNRVLNLTIVMVLHDLNLASEYCDTIAMLTKGEIYSIGSPTAVLTYEAVEKVYNTVVIVKENVLTKKPHVFVVSRDRLARNV